MKKKKINKTLIITILILICAIVIGACFKVYAVQTEGMTLGGKRLRYNKWAGELPKQTHYLYGYPSSDAWGYMPKLYVNYNDRSESNRIDLMPYCISINKTTPGLTTWATYCLKTAEEAGWTGTKGNILKYIIANDYNDKGFSYGTCTLDTQFALWEYLNVGKTTISAIYEGKKVEVVKYDGDEKKYIINQNGTKSTVPEGKVTFSETDAVVKKANTSTYLEKWGQKYGNVKNLLNATVNLLYNATQYANSKTNSTSYTPTIYTDNNNKVNIKLKDNNDVKIGPFYIKNNDNQIRTVSEIEIKRENTGYTIKSLEDEKGNTKDLKNIESGKPFYIVLDKNTKFDIYSESQTIVTLYYTYIDCDSVKLYEAYRPGTDKEQHLLIPDGEPKEKTVSNSVPFKPTVEYKPIDYTISLNKIDPEDPSIKLKDVQFEVSIDEKNTGKYMKIGTYKTDDSGKLTIPSDKLNIASDSTQKIKIKEISVPPYYEPLGTEIELTVEVEKADEVVNGVKTGAKTFAIKNVAITKNTSQNNGACTVQLAKNNNSASNKYTISLNVPNKRKKIKLSGYVWEDVLGGKESKVDGKKIDSERFIEGIQVTLHTKDNSNILYSNPPSSTKQTKTNKNGYYEFEVPMGPEYYIEFTYNGQNYQHTMYTPWSTTSSNPNKTSNATETETERDNLNKKFETITPNMSVDGTKVDNSINEKDATYIADECYRISAYTGAYGNQKDIKYYNTTSDNINLGLTKREQAAITVVKDVYKTTLSINGYTQDYIYNKRSEMKDANGNSYWNVDVRKTDAYYGTNYTRDIRSSDYNHGFGEHADKVNDNDKLSAEVTYKITIVNSSENLDTKIRELVDYYDSDYTYKEAYIQNGDQKTSLATLEIIKGYPNTQIADYNKRYIHIPDSFMVKSSDALEIYVVFEVNIDESGKLKLDKDNLGKGNMVEIISYSTYYGKNAKSPNDGNTNTYTEYKSGNIAGRVDTFSNPGNATSMDEKTFEPDTDRAPYIQFKLSDKERTVVGYVWKDARTEKVGNAVIGDGIRNEDAPIKGVTVELWRIDKDPQELIATTTTDNTGKYSISSFIPGKYYLKFIYENGQDYKSTTYNYKKVNKEFNYEDPDTFGNLVLETDQNYSDARDLYGNREYVNGLYAGEITAAKENESDNINMQAITGLMDIYIEKGGNNLSGLSGTEGLKEYMLPNVDFGLQERPKTQLMLTKEITNAKVILANGNVLFDASGRATNVMWQNKNTHEYGYDGKLMKQPRVNTKSQQVLLTMDEELMHGANINITYKISVKNIGEVDYPSKKFYYIGKKDPEENAVTTTVGDIIDYAGASGPIDEKSAYNNLKFNASENAGWTITSAKDLKDGGLVQIKDESGNDITNNIEKYSTILKYSFNFNKELKPEIENPEESTVDTTLKLSQVITPDSNSDDQKYGNMAEILSYKNEIGRRMAHSKVGNQNPDDKIAEVDADLVQLTILPPFGEKNIYYIIGISVAIIAIVGIVIVKKVLKK